MSKLANPRINEIPSIYTLNLLEQKPISLRELHTQGQLPCTPTYAAQILGCDPHPGRNESLKRAKTAPAGAFLAVDLLVVEHPGQCIQGVDLHYASTRNQARSAHAFVSSALVYPEKAHDPVPHRLEPFITQALATEAYPYRTPGQAFVETVRQAKAEGVLFKAALVDAQFTDQESLEKLRLAGVAVIGRYRTDVHVAFENERLKVRDLAVRFKPGLSRYYPRFACYVKRLRVTAPGALACELVIVWRRLGDGSLDLCVLICTLLGLGVQEVLAAWKARWALEVAHRLYKQNFSLGACMVRAFAFQLRHASLVLEAFFLVWCERLRCPGLPWRVAQARVAVSERSRVLTGLEALPA